MDNIVIVLIGAGVCCFVIGVILFLRLCKATPDENSDKELLDPEYAENFSESFKNTGSIEETLEELSNIYIDNQYMYNLVVNALEYIRDGQGDYETALEGINVDDSIEIMKLHNTAIRKALGTAVKEEPEVMEVPKELQEETKEVEVFEEDEEIYLEEVPEASKEKQSEIEMDEEITEDWGHEDDTEDWNHKDDLDGFKIG